MSAGSVILVKGDLQGILRARKLSQAAMRNIRQNLFLAFVYNIVGVPVAAGVLYPIWGVMLSPILAGAAMAFSSVSVVTNSLRLKKWRSEASAGTRAQLLSPRGDQAMAVDPVCKMTVEPAKAAAQSTYRGQTYYFCAVGCKQQFDKEPEKYLSR